MASSCIADSDAAVLDLPGLDVASEAFAAEDQVEETCYLIFGVSYLPFFTSNSGGTIRVSSSAVIVLFSRALQTEKTLVLGCEVCS